MLAPFRLGVVASALRSSGSLSGDPYFGNVVLLLHGDGASGSTVFTDSSGSPKTMTASGNAQISTAIAKFGTGAISMDGTDDWISTVTNPVDFKFGTGDFTVEAWVKTTKFGSVVINFYETAAANCWQLYIDGSGFLTWYTSNGSAGVKVLGATATNVSNGAWRHVAACRVGTTLRLFVDGAIVASGTDTRDYTPAMSQLTIGAQLSTRFSAGDFNGQIDDLRITKGVGRYSAAFTPPAAALPDTPLADASFSSVVLLLHMNGANASTTFTDSSSLAKTVTAAGNAQISTAQKKFGTASLALDGAGDYLTLAAAASNTLDGSYTVEFWLRLTALPVSEGYLIGWSGTQYVSTTTAGVVTVVSGSSHSAASAIATGAWTHVAIVRSGSTTKIYINGVGSAGSTAVGNLGSGSSPLAIGANVAGGTAIINGYIDELRITKGVARYVADFTPDAYEGPNS